MIKIIDIYIVIITVLKGLGFNAGSKFYIVAFGFGCIILFNKVIKEKYSKKEIAVMVSLLSIGILDYLIGKTTTILFTVITLCGLKNVDLKHIIKVVFYAKIITFVMMILGSSIGIIENTQFLFYRDGQFLNRQTFGYSHPNETHAMFMIIAILYLYLYYEKINIFSIGAIAVLNYIMYSYTYSRTGYWVVIMCLIIVFLEKHIGIMKKIILWFSKNAYIYLFLITIFISLMFGKIEFINKIDSILSGRIEYNNTILTKVRPGIIGTTEVTNM